MPFYNVRITLVGQKRGEAKLDLDLDSLERQFLAPYRQGLPITVNGKVIKADHISRIEIHASAGPSDELIAFLKHQDQNSSVLTIGGPSYPWRAAGLGENLTDQFITGPPGLETPALPAAKVATEEAPKDALMSTGSPPRPAPAGRSVFVVAGRDTEATGALVAVLRALSLNVVEWGHAIIKTGLPNPYVGDVVVAGLQMADAAIVILTPDDRVQLREDLVNDNDGPQETSDQYQARPNVYYEAGIADALGKERTVIVEIGAVKPFSDAGGRHTVKYDGSAPLRHTLVQRLRIAGLDPDDSGTDWLEVGDLPPRS